MRILVELLASAPCVRASCGQSLRFSSSASRQQDKKRVTWARVGVALGMRLLEQEEARVPAPQLRAQGALAKQRWAELEMRGSSAGHRMIHVPQVKARTKVRSRTQAWEERHPRSSGRVGCSWSARSQVRPCSAVAVTRANRAATCHPRQRNAPSAAGGKHGGRRHECCSCCSRVALE